MRETYSTSSGQLSYLRAGSGPCLFLMHGLGGNANSWQEQLDQLSPSYDVIAWDAPGFGQSDVVEADPEAFAKAALSLLDHLQVEQTVLVGHSMGGVIAQTLAGLAPKRVSALMLSCTWTGSAAPKGAPLAERYAKRLNDLKTLSREAFGAARAASMVAPSADEQVRARVAAIASQVRADGYESACRLLSEADTRHIAKNITCPTVVIAGEQDLVIARDRVDALASLIPGSELVEIRGAGHAPYLEQTAAFNAEINRLFERITKN